MCFFLLYLNNTQTWLFRRTSSGIDPPSLSACNDLAFYNPTRHAVRFPELCRPALRRSQEDGFRLAAATLRYVE